MKIFPEKIIKTKGSDGTTFISEIYSLEAYRNNGFLYIIFLFMVTGLLAPVISAILLLFYCIDVNKKPIMLNIIGLIASIYLLLDFYKGWIISLLVSLFFHGKEINFVINLNIALIFCHIICLVASGWLLKITKEDKMGTIACILGLCIALYFFLSISHISEVFKKNLGNPDFNTGTINKVLAPDSLLTNPDEDSSSNIKTPPKFLIDSLKKSQSTMQDENKIDSDNNAILSQVWASNNLNVTNFNNGDLIYEAQTPEDWQNAGDNGIPAYCLYNNDVSNLQVGRLYNWYALNDSRGLAPSGWHIPNKKDWNQLIENFKEHNYFTPLMGGFRNSIGEFRAIDESVIWWSASEYNSNEAFYFFLNSENDKTIDSNHGEKGAGYYIRCIKN